MRSSLLILLLAGCAAAPTPQRPSGSARPAALLEKTGETQKTDEKERLDRELIRRVIKSHKSEIRSCYETELARAPELNGKITVRFVIAGSGAVSSATIAASTMENATVETCLTDRVKGWIFPKPKPGGPVIVTYPFVFKLPSRP